MTTRFLRDAAIILGAFLAAALLVSCTHKRPTDPGVSLPNVATSAGRAELLGELVEDTAARYDARSKPPLKDGFALIASLSNRQRGEFRNIHDELGKAQEERASLINQVIDKTRDQIAAKKKYDESWFGGRFWHLVYWALGIWAGLGIVGLVLGVTGFPLVSSFIMRLIPLAQPFADLRDRINTARNPQPVAVIVNAAPPTETR